jgi:hypothetical protein
MQRTSDDTCRFKLERMKYHIDHYLDCNLSYKYHKQGYLDFDDNISQTKLYVYEPGEYHLYPLKTHDVLLVDPESMVSIVKEVQQQLEELKEQMGNIPVLCNYVLERIAEDDALQEKRGLLMLSEIRTGTDIHRAVLFKYLCDHFSRDYNTYCRLVRGESTEDHCNRTWNVILVKSRQCITHIVSWEVHALSWEAKEYVVDDCYSVDDNLKRSSKNGCGGDSIRLTISGNDLDKIRIEKKPIGAGTYGAVYRAYDNNNLKYALKIINNVSVQSKREEQIMLIYNHPCITTLISSWRAKNRHYMLMLLMNCNATEFYKRATKLHVPFRAYIVEVVYLIYKAARGIQYLHCKNVLHRDIKPANILVNMIEENGSLQITDVKIADFGFSKMLGHDYSTISLGGTLLYMVS